MRLSPRTPGFWVGTLALTLVTALVAFAVVTTLTLRERALSNETENLHLVSLPLAEHANRILFSADLIASSFEERLLQAGARTPHDFRQLAATPQMHQALHEAVLLTADVDAVSLIDAEGRFLNSSRTFPVPTLSLADRDYFVALRDTPGQPYVISSALKNRLTGQESIFLARRVTSTDGRFLGVITASISTSRFAKLFAAMLHGPSNGVSLYRRDGTLLVSEPAPREARATHAEVAGFLEQTLDRGEKGALRTTSSSEAGGPELLALSAVRGYPLAVVASNTQGAALSDWTRLAWLVGLGTAGTAGLTLVLGGVLLRQWRMQMQLQEAGKLRRLNEELQATIVERRRAQEDLLRAYDENRAVTEAVHDILFMLGPDGRLSWWNRRTEVVIGWSADRLRDAQAIEFFDQADRPAVVEAIARAATEGQVSLEARLLTVDGPREYQFNGVRIQDAQGKLVGIAGSARDVSERKRAEAERSSLEMQLRESQRMESIGTLAGGIAHDFNNILGAILGNVAVARGEMSEGHEAHKSLAQIHKAGVRARDLVQQILAFSRRQPQQMVTQPVRPLVEEAMSLMRTTLPAGVVVDIALTDMPLYLTADATQIQQVLMNLCTNAWHALKDGTGRISVGLEALALDEAEARAIGALPPGRYAHLWVRDNGIGMDAKTRERIFEPFFTTKPPGQGTGLGLAVVHGIVTAHHGALSVDSEPGKGSTFHLYFPTQEPAVALPGPAASSPESVQGHGEHVLYVDDDEVMLLMVERLLQQKGYRTTCRQNAQEVLAAVRAAPDSIDVVVTDYNMPAGSGVDLAAELAKIRPGLPVVIGSGYVSEELQTRARQVGARDVYRKEDTFDELPRLLRRVLSQGGAVTGRA